MLLNVGLQDQRLSIETLEELLLEGGLTHPVEVSGVPPEVDHDDGVTGVVPLCHDVVGSTFRGEATGAVGGRGTTVEGPVLGGDGWADTLP
jgi:hypothetical protein